MTIELPPRGFILTGDVGKRFVLIEPHRTLDGYFFIGAVLPSGDTWHTPGAIHKSEVPNALERLWTAGFDFGAATWTIKTPSSTEIYRA